MVTARYIPVKTNVGVNVGLENGSRTVGVAKSAVTVEPLQRMTKHVNSLIFVDMTVWGYGP